jgi:hypothetical protein
MEGGHWHVVRALMGAHESDMLGPYFLPAVAQQGRVKDLGEMVKLLKEIGCHKEDYVASQISSAMVSAALAGHLDMLLALEGVREELAAGTLLGAGLGAGEDEGGGVGTEEDEEDDYVDEAEEEGSTKGSGGGGGGAKTEL